MSQNPSKPPQLPKPVPQEPVLKQRETHTRNPTSKQWVKRSGR